ncbi:3377_t:CDS:2 [Diversispora eburnea]|uniref:3377_t:CDS:1 n=1 Tax=Diversispora eburnea TaxID=1213867 RepID=A0A9N8WRZ4_9GLOM|nr:3377_t:CDS:2 [Diversispora eburnea]
MIQSESQLNEKEEIKGNQNGEESDDKTERTIKNLRITSATPLEQNTELLRFIAKKESKVLELREELKRQEEELKLLKNQWKTIVANDEQEKNGTSTTSSEIVGDDGIKFIGKGINSVIDGIHKVKDNEVTLEKISQIKTAVSDVANSTSVKKTRQAWSNISKGFSSLVESKAVKTAKRKTLETVHTVERTINEALISQTKPSYTQYVSNFTITSDISDTEENNNSSDDDD